MRISNIHNYQVVLKFPPEEEKQILEQIRIWYVQQILHDFSENCLAAENWEMMEEVFMAMEETFAK